MVTVCDKCSKPEKIKVIFIDKKKFELCDTCVLKVIEYIENKNKNNKSPFERMLGQ